MTYHVRNKEQTERRHKESLKKLLKYLEGKPQKGMIVAQTRALHWAINTLEKNETPQALHSHIQAVMEEVIGENEKEAGWTKGGQPWINVKRNQLRAEQRQRLAKYLERSK